MFFAFVTSGYKKPDVYKIDATKNAYLHNNIGLQYLSEKYYAAAIQEFKIAISLSPNTQATASYYTNLGDTYMIIGHPDLAQDCYERALNQYSLNFKYYKNLAKCYKQRNILSGKIKQYSEDPNPLSKIMLGLLYAESGNINRAIILLDEFAMSEPDLMITISVKQEIRELVKQVNQNQT